MQLADGNAREKKQPKVLEMTAAERQVVQMKNFLGSHQLLVMSLSAMPIRTH
jgi:hypothetical protein